MSRLTWTIAFTAAFAVTGWLVEQWLRTILSRKEE